MKKNIFRRQIGSSLIEVMVALLVTAVGLLGVLSMQTKAIAFNKNAHLYTQATILANNILESMQATPSDLNMYLGSHSGLDCVANPCTSQQLAQWYKQTWVSRVEETLPEGVGTIAPSGATGEVAITVSFLLGYEKNDDGSASKITDSVVFYTEG